MVKNNKRCFCCASEQTKWMKMFSYNTQQKKKREKIGTNGKHVQRYTIFQCIATRIFWGGRYLLFEQIRSHVFADSKNVLLKHTREYKRMNERKKNDSANSNRQMFSCESISPTKYRYIFSVQLSPQTRKPNQSFFSNSKSNRKQQGTSTYKRQQLNTKNNSVCARVSDFHNVSCLFHSVSKQRDT